MSGISDKCMVLANWQKMQYLIDIRSVQVISVRLPEG